MLKKLLLNKHNKTLLNAVNQMHPFDIASESKQLSREEFDELMHLINDELAADVLSYLDPEDAAKHLEAQSFSEQVSLLDAMEIDDAVDILSELDDDQQETLIPILEKADQLEHLLDYEDDEAGAYMTTEMIVLSPNMGVKAATKKMIAEAPNAETIRTLYVVDDDGVLVGQVSLKQLIAAKPPTTIADLTKEVRAFNVKDSIEDIALYLKDYSHFVTPVVSDGGVLVGMITLDDAIEAYALEASEDYTKLAATSKSDETSLFKAAGYRFVWLLILAVVNIPLILITGLFEEVLASFAILVMFQPLILALSGNVATQTLAITLLFLNKEGGSARNLAKREIGAGVISGVVLSVVAGLAAALIAYIIKSPYIWQVGLMIGLSLFLCVAIAPFIGFIVPFTLNKLKIDPSAASGPLITSLVDLIAIIIYFGLATLILGGMI